MCFMGYFLEVIPQTHTCFSLYKICLMIIQKLFEIKPCTIVLLNLFYVARFLMLWIKFFFVYFCMVHVLMHVHIFGHIISYI